MAISDFLSSPMGLASLGMAQGMSPGDAILQGQKQVAFQQQQQRAQQQRERMAQVEQALPQLIAQVDPADPTGSLGKLIQGGIPLDVAQQVIGIAQKQAQQESLNQERSSMQGLIDRAMSGELGESDEAAGYILSGSRDPMQAGVGQMLIEKRKEQRQIEKETRAEERRTEQAEKKSAVPGFKLTEGVELDPKAVGSAREAATAAETFKLAVQQVKDFIDKEGSAIYKGQDVDEASSILSTLLNAERSLNETGVLNLGEIPVLEKFYATFDPRNPLNLTKSREEMKEAADVYLNNKLDQLDVKMKAIGYKPEKEREAKKKPTGQIKFLGFE